MEEAVSAFKSLVGIKEDVVKNPTFKLPKAIALPIKKKKNRSGIKKFADRLTGAKDKVRLQASLNH
jgi:hypothetical protein